MTIHYHGTPISPRSVLRTLGGKFFCVSFASPQDVIICHQIGQGVMLDNGAFSAWKSGKKTDWPGYYIWAEQWLTYPTTWAVIPDFIDGDEVANDKLVREWPHGHMGAPVWHLHESISRLLGLIEAWPRVCMGSSAQYSKIGSEAWRRRMDEAFNAISARGPIPWLHMLRGMSLSGREYPFASVDSTDVARNHNRDRTAKEMAERWDALNCAAAWQHREQLSLNKQPREDMHRDLHEWAR
jgi:hypothetical protein